MSALKKTLTADVFYGQPLIDKRALLLHLKQVNQRGKTSSQPTVFPSWWLTHLLTSRMVFLLESFPTVLLPPDGFSLFPSRMVFPPFPSWKGFLLFPLGWFFHCFSSRMV